MEFVWFGVSLVVSQVVKIVEKKTVKFGRPNGRKSNAVSAIQKIDAC